MNKEIIKKQTKVNNNNLNLQNKIEATREITEMAKVAIENQTKENSELFDLLKKEMDATKPSDEFYKMAEQAMNDNSKLLETATEEDKQQILVNQLEILKEVGKREKESMELNREIRKDALNKDTENKQYKWSVLKLCCGTIILAIGSYVIGPKGIDVAKKLLEK